MERQHRQENSRVADNSQAAIYSSWVKRGGLTAEVSLDRAVQEVREACVASGEREMRLCLVSKEQPEGREATGSSRK